VTVLKRMPLKVRVMLVLCALVVVVEIVSGLIEVSTNYKPLRIGKRLVEKHREIGKHRERKDVTLMNDSLSVEDDMKISERPTEVEDPNPPNLYGTSYGSTNSTSNADSMSPDLVEGLRTTYDSAPIIMDSVPKHSDSVPLGSDNASKNPDDDEKSPDSLPVVVGSMDDEEDVVRKRRLVP